MKKRCKHCYHQHKLSCPPSIYCFGLKTKPYWRPKINMDAENKPEGKMTLTEKVVVGIGFVIMLLWIIQFGLSLFKI